MKKLITIVLIIAILLVGFLVAKTKYGVSDHVDLSMQTLPKTCVDQEEGTPVITSLSNYLLSSTGIFEVRGCNFSGFEGDKDVWIVNSEGVKGYVLGAQASTNNKIEVVLTPKLCQQNNNYSGNDCTAWLDLVPGTYKLYTEPWGKNSNEVLFEIK